MALSEGFEPTPTDHNIFTPWRSYIFLVGLSSRTPVLVDASTEDRKHFKQNNKSEAAICSQVY